MIGDEDQPLRKLKLHSPVGPQLNLSSDRLVTAHSNGCRAPDLGHESYGQTEEALGHGYVSVVPVAVDKVQRQTDELGEENATIMLAMVRSI